MIFSVEVDGKPLWRRIIERDGYNRQPVTATGRRLLEGDCILIEPDNCTCVYNANDNLRYRVGQTRVLVPGPCQPGVWYRKSLSTTPGTIGCKRIEFSCDDAVLEQYKSDCITHGVCAYNVWLYSYKFKKARITITELQIQDVRTMTDAQAQRTGFASAGDYLAWWVNQYGKLYTMLYIGFKFEAAE